MLSTRHTRSGLNSGRYLFFNPLLIFAMTMIDFVVRCASRPVPLGSMSAPRRILVSCTGHIGDVILATSALPVLRAAYPLARIGVLVHPASKVVVQNHSLVDTVHVYEHWKLNRRSVSLVRKIISYMARRPVVVSELRREDYDLAIDLYAYFPNNAVLLASSGIPVRIGWTSGGLGGWYSHGVDWHEGGRHVVEWHRRLLGELPQCRPFLHLARPVLETSSRAAADWAEARKRVVGSSPYIACHVGAGAARKRWPDRHWLELVRGLEELRLPVLLLGQGPEDEALCRSIAAEVAVAIDLTGRLEWEVMSVALSLAQLVIGLDSMGSHVAAAWNVPIVCISTGQTGPEWRPYGRQVRMVTSPTPCTPCYLPNGCPGMDCIRKTPAGAVGHEARAALSQRAGNGCDLDANP